MSNNSDKSLSNGMAFNSIQFIELINDADLIQEVSGLLTEYGNYMYEDLGLIAGKERFFKELENFPGPGYFPPSGTFVLARVAGMIAGCVGIKKFEDGSCEMKRMYIRPAYRGKGIGRLLCSYIIDWCRKAMYRRILLDTNAEMKEALFLYRKCGFKEIAPYCINENDHPVFMEYAL
jgi:GNAT superfamily N-acetyltransferase